MHQNEPPYDRIEPALGRHLHGIAKQESNVLDARGLYALPGYLDSFRRAVDANHFSLRTGKRGAQQCDVSGSAANVQHPHPVAYACSLKHPQCERLVNSRLHAQTPQFPLGMAECVRRFAGRLLHISMLDYAQGTPGPERAAIGYDSDPEEKGSDIHRCV